MAKSITESKSSDKSATQSVAYSIPLEKLEHHYVLFPADLWIPGTMLITINSYHAEELDQIDLEVGDLIELLTGPSKDDNYWLKGICRSDGQKNGQIGYFPMEKVAIKDPLKESIRKKSLIEAMSEEIFPTPVSKGTVVVAIYAFEASKQDELSFAVGATIIVSECPDGGWWKGITGIEEKNPVTGWFPANLVTVTELSLRNKDLLKVENDEKNDTQAATGPKQVSWFKRLRAGENGIEAPVSRNRAALSANQPLFDSPSKRESVCEVKHVFDESSRSSQASVDGKALIEYIDETGLKARRASISSMVSKATLFGFTQTEIMQGAIEEKVQDRVGPAIFKFLSDHEKKRLSVVWELLQTERDYVRDLTIIQDIFMKPMSNFSSLGAKNMQLLFANMEQILAVNTDFLSQLIQIEDIRSSTSFAEIFLTMVLMESNIRENDLCATFHIVVISNQILQNL